MQKTVVEISTGTIVKVILFILLIASLYYLRNIVAVVLFSIVVASAVEPASTWFEKRKVPRTLAVLSIYLLMFFVFAFVFYLVVPTFISEIANLASSLPHYLENPTSLKNIFSFLPITEGSLTSIFEDLFENLQNKTDAFAAGFFNTAANIFGGAVSFLMIVVISFYLSVQKGGLETLLRIITPKEYEGYILNLWQRSRTKIGRWLQGQILLGILVGTLVYLGLTILGVEYALSFALLAAVFELIPVFGPILASIPPIIVAFLQSPSLALVVLLLYIIIQQFENHLIYPLVVRKIVGVPPILVILSIIVGAQLGGFFGILLAIPVAAVLREFLNDVAAKKHIAS